MFYRRVYLSLARPPRVRRNAKRVVSIYFSRTKIKIASRRDTHGGARKCSNTQTPTRLLLLHRNKQLIKIERRPRESVSALGAPCSHALSPQRVTPLHESALHPRSIRQTSSGTHPDLDLVSSLDGCCTRHRHTGSA